VEVNGNEENGGKELENEKDKKEDRNKANKKEIKADELMVQTILER
jgi:hypothetical protein